MRLRKHAWRAWPVPRPSELVSALNCGEEQSARIYEADVNPFVPGFAIATSGNERLAFLSFRDSSTPTEI